MIDFLQLLQTVCISISCIFVLLLLKGLSRKFHCKARQDLKASVLVAARNESQAIPDLLADLAAQDYPRTEIEFIIIDDGSSDGTDEIVDELVRKDARFKLISLDDASVQGMGPKKRALSAGIKASSGDIVMVTDADCRLATNWVGTTVGCFDETTAAVCGLVRFRKPAGFWGRLAAFEGFANTVLNAGVIGIGGALSCGGANFAYRRSAFEEAGGFDTGSGSFSGDDDLLLQRFRATSKKIRFNRNPETAVITDGPENRAAYFSRKRRHMSAGKRYSFHWIILAVIIYTGCLSTVLLTLFNVFGSSTASTSLAFWAALSVCIFVLLLIGARLFQQMNWFIWSLLSAVLFPILFVVIQPLTLLPSPAWKGRRIEEAK